MPIRAEDPNVRTIQIGMDRAQVVAALGAPDGVTAQGDYEALKYANRLMSGWSWDRADYVVILKEGRVVEYGNGQVRQNGPPNAPVLLIVQP